jgi:hypothetical protein
LTKFDRKLNVLNTYYSHVSRLFVSNYAAFFTIFLAFLALFYNLYPKDQLSKRLLGYGSFLIVVFELLLFYRAYQFGRILDQIDNMWAKEMNLINVKMVFWNPSSWHGRFNSVYRFLAFPFGIGVIVLTLILGVYLLRWV